MKSVHAIRFVHFEDLGSFSGALENSGYAIRYADVGKDDIDALDALRPDLLICLGGPIGAYEENTYPVLKPVMAVIERRITAGLPTMGICLGAQIIARVLGARVYQGGRKEIGWSTLRLTESGRRGCLRHLGSGSTPVLHGMAILSTSPAEPRCWPPATFMRIRLSPLDLTCSDCSSIPK